MTLDATATAAWAKAEKWNTAGEPKIQEAIRRRESTANNVLTILKARC